MINRSCFIISLLLMITGCAPNTSSSSTRTATSAAPTDTGELPSGDDKTRAVERARQLARTSSFATQSHWYDGRAEVSLYRATRERYGQLREFDLKLIMVKEDFDPQKLIKSDRPGQLNQPLYVMKTQLVYDMPTQNYTYHMGASVYSDLGRPGALVKAVMTSHELCGITTKHVDMTGEQPTLDYNSYFESEGDGEVVLDWPEGGLLEEQLFFYVRAFVASGDTTRQVSVLNRQLTSHHDAPVWRSMTITRAPQPETITDASGVSHEVSVVTLAREGKAEPEMTFKVTKDYPHVLIEHQSTGGFSMRLKKSVRWAYWDVSKSNPLRAD